MSLESNKQKSVFAEYLKAFRSHNVSPVWLQWQNGETWKRNQSLLVWGGGQVPLGKWGEGKEVWIDASTAQREAEGENLIFFLWNQIHHHHHHDNNDDDENEQMLIEHEHVGIIFNQPTL